MATEDNISTIRALLAKTIENGATESEAMQSFSIAKKLMEKHGITMSDIENKTIKLDSFVWGSHATEYEKSISSFDKCIAPYIADYTNTKSIIYGFKSVEKKKHGKYMSMFFGHKIDVELAIYMMNMCNAALATEWALYKASVFQKIHGNRVKNFSIGMATRICEKLVDLMAEEIAATNNELMVIKNELVVALFPDAMKGLNVTDIASTGLVKYDDDDSYKKGYESGDKVEMHKTFNDKKVLKISKGE